QGPRIGTGRVADGRLEGAVAPAQQDVHRAAADGIGHGQVRDTVAAEVSHRQRDGRRAGREAGAVLEGAVAVAQEHGHRAAADVIGDRKVELTVAVEVLHAHGAGIGAGGVAAWSLEGAVAVARKTCTVPELTSLATARSGRPSPLKSATTTDEGLVPATKLTGRRKTPVPERRSTLTVPLEEFVTTRSGLPSPLTSATAKALGPLPAVGELLGAWNPPPPLLRSTLTVPGLTLLVTARSGRPSLLKSPTATARALGPAS